MKILRTCLVALFFPLTATAARADVMCAWFGYCMYESPGFKIRIVDQDGKPLTGVHGLAAWIQYGSHGTGGPLMALDAMSGADGVLTFPAWGPLKGSSAGIEIALAPGISLFKPGYKHQIINNASSLDERARVRPFTRDGQTFKMEVFNGNTTVWRQELFDAAYPTLMERVGATDRKDVRGAYLRRKRLVRIEAERLPLSSFFSMRQNRFDK